LTELPAPIQQEMQISQNTLLTRTVIRVTGRRHLVQQVLPSLALRGRKL
jgi:hypothetical protein